MSERPSAKPDTDYLRWDPATGDQSEPATGKKDDGWAVNALVPSTELNWVWAKRYELGLWLGYNAIREFAAIHEAIQEVGLGTMSVPDVFRVHAPAAGLNARGAQLLHAQGDAGAVNVVDIVTDGLAIAYAQGGSVYGWDPVTGTQPADWNNPYTQSPGAGNVVAMAADGRYFYVFFAYSATAGYHEIHTLDSEDGSSLSSTDQTGTTDAIAAKANGAYLAYLLSGNNNLIVYSVGGSGVVSYGGVYNHGANLYGLAVDDLYAYIGGAQGTGSYDVRSVKLSDRSLQWSVALPTTAAPTVNAIWTDGDLIYVGINSATATAAWGSGTINVVALNKVDGSVVWVGNVANNCTRLCGDDRWLYASNSAATPVTYALDKWTGQRVWILSATGFEAYEADGIGVVGTDGATYVRRLARGDGSRFFQLVSGDDINRRPFFNLAIPVAQGAGK